VAPHLSFGLDDDALVAEMLETYRQAGVTRIVALRGDVPSGLGGREGLRYASELVAFIRHLTGRHFHIEVAAYPEIHPDSPSTDQDIRYLKAKVDAGADSIITQYFYNPDAFFHYRDLCTAAGVRAPIIPGVMPITNYDSLKRFSDKCGAEIPRWICRRLESLAQDPQGLRSFGEDVVTRLCERLLAGGVPGLHLYTLNRARASERICRNLGFGSPGA
jgi:methylenetetrahydrofolate reductase (NADPH)